MGYLISTLEDKVIWRENIGSIYIELILLQILSSATNNPNSNTEVEVVFLAILNTEVEVVFLAILNNADFS